MNNIVKMELNQNFLTIIGFMIAPIMLITLSVFIYPTFANDLDQFVVVVTNMPTQISSGLGINIAIWDVYDGFYSYIFTYIKLVSFIFSAVMTIKIFGSERIYKSNDFILVKPINRAKIYLSKLIAVLVMILAYFIVITCYLFLLVGIRLEEYSFTNLLDLQLSLIFIMVIASSITTLYVYAIKKKLVPSAGFIFGFIFFMLSFMANIYDSDLLAKISIYGLFDNNELVMNGFNINQIIWSLAIIILCYGISLTMYIKKDVVI